MRKLTLVAMPSLLALAAAAKALVFTGNVSEDFISAVYVEAADSTHELVLPVQAPVGTLSGWDLSRVLFQLDAATDQLNIGLDYAALAGDADGDGVEGVSSLWLATGGGMDEPRLGPGGSVCVAFDFDQNGRWDVVAGYPLGVDAYQVAIFTGEDGRPYQAFGEPLPVNQGAAFCEASAQAPDVEFSLIRASALLVFQEGTACFAYKVFSGSFDDGAIGEDLLQGTVCLSSHAAMSTK